MNLKERVSNQVAFIGKTPGGCKLVLRNLLDDGRDVFQFMQLFSQEAIVGFYRTHQEEIGELCREEEELTIDARSVRGYVKLALEKTLMLIEGEIKNDNCH